MCGARALRNFGRRQNRLQGTSTADLWLQDRPVLDNLRASACWERPDKREDGMILSGRHRLQPTPSTSCRLCGARRSAVVRAVTAVPEEYKAVSPVGDRIFVKVDAAEEKSVGGILLPSSAVKKATQGSVVSPGTAQAVKEGQTVVYSKYAGTEISLKGTDHVLLKEDDVIGLLSTSNIADLKPLGDRILISVEKARDRSEGGVILSGDAKDRPTLGKVLAVGSGKADDKGNVVKPTVSVGDVVLYQQYAGTEFQGDKDEQFIVVRETDVLATVA